MANRRIRCGYCHDFVNQRDRRVHAEPCRHVFHQGCMRDWRDILQRDDCPKCQWPLNEIENPYGRPRPLPGTSPGTSRLQRCAVCQEGIDPNSTVGRTSCRHFFHPECIVERLEIEGGPPVCPACNATIREDVRLVHRPGRIVTRSMTRPLFVSPYPRPSSPSLSLTFAPGPPARWSELLYPPPPSMESYHSDAESPGPIVTFPADSGDSGPWPSPPRVESYNSHWPAQPGIESVTTEWNARHESGSTPPRMEEWTQPAPEDSAPTWPPPRRMRGRHQ